MAPREIVFFDTSVLLAGLVDLGSVSEAAQGVMTAVAERRVRQPRTAWHCCLEFYSVATRLPPEYRLKPTDAILLLDHEVLSRFVIEDLPLSARKEFLSEIAASGIAGGRVYDCHIAEIGRRAGARVVVTENVRHFASLGRHGVRVLSAAEFLTTI